VRLEIGFITALSGAASANPSSKLTVSAHDLPQGYWCVYNRSSAAASRGRPEFCLFTHACSILSLRSVICIDMPRYPRGIMTRTYEKCRNSYEFQVLGDLANEFSGNRIRTQRRTRRRPRVIESYPL
jgi:hypothetical protein